jgi:hypothetical protein
MASIHVRPRNKGKSYELRIKHRLLSRPFYATLESEEEARRVGERGLAELNLGKIPSWMCLLSIRRTLQCQFAPPRSARIRTKPQRVRLEAS